MCKSLLQAKCPYGIRFGGVDFRKAEVKIVSAEVIGAYTLMFKKGENQPSFAYVGICKKQVNQFVTLVA